jgi:hypothetical protein
LNAHGIDVFELRNQLQKIFGLPPYSPNKKTNRDVGISGLINDVFTVLHTEELKALFEANWKPQRLQGTG